MPTTRYPNIIIFIRSKPRFAELSLNPGFFDCINITVTVKILLPRLI